ncbi:two component transcriptional regulator, winged helix family [Coriobacterium glomerans PW2]|uniref:Two component transcriptional regulator, winged helix family n=1 Tax=Coriobacterium glomerans (strain ATCC 49209 / DSM 20642 / JCM 10262 / PW2) TaxID=700015 RepID=F2N910_CORGP|nr:response regulator transcription factor [Coriobacterium glomerans]AEB07610.1 two component transcriptional regulator, winged helix family [Coriobacterium glomerans PW2]
MRLLVVEDERDLADAIAEGLRLDGYAVETCADGQMASELLAVESYDLVILDLNLPGKDGIEILRELRESARDIKVLILSARSSVADRVNGLDSGANDYLIKPFAFEELEARIRALTHRSFTQAASVLRCGDLRLDTIGRTLRVGSREIALTRKELAVLEHLLLHRGEVVSQEDLLDHIWDRDANTFSNVVRVHVASLRKKLRAEVGDDVVKTRIGEGYYID